MQEPGIASINFLMFNDSCDLVSKECVYAFNQRALRLYILRRDVGGFVEDMILGIFGRSVDVCPAWRTGHIGGRKTTL